MLSPVIGPPDHFCFDLSLCVRSGLIAVQGKSETAKDTAKVLGTGAAGAVIGHQVSHKNGAIVGGILGTAGGLAIAKNTGSEVEIASGSVVGVSLNGGFEVAAP